MRLRRHHVIALTIVAGVAVSARSLADVPPGYKGTPFKGAPAAIPGRINLVDYDMGGVNVGFNTVHNSGAAPVGCAGSDYRTDLPVPTLCKTSQMDGDHYTAGPLTGMRYPSPTTDDYYIGAIRPNDWVNVTVDVKTPGTYVLSSTWASAGGSIDMKVFFNDVSKNETKAPTTGGYHNWVPFPNYAMVTLEQGVQVMKFQSVVEHLNWDYIQFSLVLPDGGVDNGDPDAAAGGVDAGGDATAGGAGGAGGGAGAGGSSATGSTTGGGDAGQGGASTATTGTSTTTSSATGGSAGQTTSGNSSNDAGGCACALGGAARAPGAGFAALLALLALGRRRRARFA